MARPRIEDFYHNFRFHLIDVTPTSGVTIPNLILALSPQIGFQSVSSPELTLEVKEIKPGNRPHPHKSPKSASYGDIVLSRGVFVGDDEFYKWIRQAQYGRGQYKRNLLLVQMHSYSRAERPSSRLEQIGAASASAVASSSFGAIGDLISGVAVESGADISNIASRVWRLDGCFPKVYKPASDFDASESGISVQELTLDVDFFDEHTFGPSPQSKGVIGLLG